MTAGAEAAEILERARKLAGALRDQSDAIEAARRLPERWVAPLAEAGLFRLCVPASLGGPELSPGDLVRVLEALARGDASAGWCAMIASTSSVLAAWLPADDAREMFGPPDAVAGGVFAPRGRAERVSDGYRVTGRWSFASGCQHCTWLMGGCTVQGEDGPERLPGGAPDVRLALFPAGRAEILDTWDVSGLRGTGSHDIEVQDVFVPAARAVSLISDTPRETGALYRFPVFGLLAVGVGAVAIGIGRRALDALAELAGGKTPTLGRRTLAQRPATQSQLAEAEALLGSARSYLLESVEVATAAAGERALDAGERARIRLAATHAARSAAAAVDRAYTLGGGSSIYRESDLQRCFRDVHALTQHAMVGGSTLELAGRVLLGVDADVSML